MMRVCVIFHRLGPYHDARLRALSGRCQLSVLELSARDSTYAWDTLDVGLPYPRLTLFEDLDRNPASRRLLAGRLSQALDRLRPEVLAVPGWSHPAALAALAWCRTRGV